MLRAILAEDLARVEKLVTIDFHTGLGMTGACEMIVEDLPDSPAWRRAKEFWGARVASATTGESVSVPVTGSLDQAMAAWLPKVELTYGVLEVGTCSLVQMLNVLRQDNWLYNFAPDQGLAPYITRASRDAFFPDQADWKAQVFGHAMAAIRPVLAAL